MPRPPHAPARSVPPRHPPTALVGGFHIESLLRSSGIILFHNAPPAKIIALLSNPGFKSRIPGLYFASYTTLMVRSWCSQIELGMMNCVLEYSVYNYTVGSLY